MVTTSHGILAFLFNRYLNRKLKTRVPPFFIILGAMLPDFFHVTNTILEWLWAKILLSKWHWEFLLDISRYLHSFPIFALTFTTCFFAIFIICNGLFYGRTLAFFFGWGFFHILIDVITHKGMAWPYFWPWTKVPIYGLIDHSEPLLVFIELIISVFTPAFYFCRWIRKRKPRCPTKTLFSD